MTSGGGRQRSERANLLDGVVSGDVGGNIIYFSYSHASDEVPGTSTAVAQCLAEIRLQLGAGSDAQTVTAIERLYRAFDEIADVERVPGSAVARLVDALALTPVPGALVQRLQELVGVAATARGRRGTAPPAARELLAQAKAGLEEAEVLETANERYATAHLAALRTAAAVLAVRGRPEERPGRRKRIRSAWEVIPEIAPELAEWSALFAAGARNRARAEAGIQGAVSFVDADDMIRSAGMFLRIVERTVLGQVPRHSHPLATDPAASTRQGINEAAEPGASPSEEADSAGFGDLPVGHTPPGPPLDDDDDEWDE